MKNFNEWIEIAKNEATEHKAIMAILVCKKIALNMYHNGEIDKATKQALFKQADACLS